MWSEVLTAVVTSGIISVVATGIQNRRIRAATANNSNADYADKIIAQSDKRVQQALDDINRAWAERDEARSDAKGQRKAKQEWRERYFAEQKLKHSAELRLKDAEARIAELEWHKCELNGCERRTPPRKRERQ